VDVVVGPGRVVGQRLVEHPEVAKIGFTRSTEVGRGVMEAAAGTINRVTLELGGKSANVVFADANLERAAAAAPAAVFGNAARTAAPARGSSSSGRSTTGSSLCSPTRPRRCGWAIRRTTRPRWAH
jgi:delta 1-pyrroline-5-carboxylate dehydrogenase